MMEWSVAVAAGAFVILSAFMIAVLMNLRRLIKQLQGTILQMEERTRLLTVDAVQLLQRTDHTVLMMQEHIRKTASFVESMEAAGTVIRSTTQQVDHISSAISHSVMQHVQHAHEENQQRMSPLFRSLDAGLTLWSTWQRFSKASGESDPSEKE
ncbi:DUF948 domain-containing protein [Paenibacillus gallinarum]|uniref:DUF948 domain-containing protein n=1 Tax=Paenibacillus gallinarum TaxID=2762232 RepID=A0ABR8SUN4_9BACL|nr:DUF948 domain-containing protein [Paenibacillus gallinarum]MBD7967033.1 DUF948 domain-containing protein [Paenibacillus gallinarum]